MSLEHEFSQLNAGDPWFQGPQSPGLGFLRGLRKSSDMAGKAKTVEPPKDCEKEPAKHLECQTEKKVYSSSE